MALYNRVWFTTATTGTGTITVGSALSGYRTPADASVPNAGTFQYTIIDGAAWEVGTGTYTSSGTTVARSLIESSTGALLNLSGSATMFITAAASTFGTAAFVNTGTSGGTVPLCNTTNVFSARQDVASTFRASGVSNFAAGAGLEFSYNSGAGLGALLAYDRSVSAYKDLDVTGNTVTINIAGSQLYDFTSTGLDLASGTTLKLGGTQLLTSRRTGWGAPTGTATRTTFATGSVTTAQLAERVKALIDDLTTHGVIGA